MGRSRSPSPGRRRRSRSRDWERKRRHRRSRSRSVERRRRSRTPDRERDYNRHSRRSRSRSHSRERPSKKNAYKPPEITEDQLVGKSEEEVEMLKLMGFCNFDTTKGRKVKKNDVGDVNVSLKRKYRQYMNRRGGFNKPLDRVA